MPMLVIAGIVLIALGLVAIGIAMALARRGQAEGEAARTAHAAALARAEERGLRVAPLEAQLADAAAALAAAREALAREQAARAEQAAAAAEKLRLLTEAREAMANQFSALAEGVMTRHGEAFARQNQEQVDRLLAPLRERIGEFQANLQTAQIETAKERAQLTLHITQLSASSARLDTETANLTRALKGESQVQGAWGEMILASILERSGLREGEHYDTQQSHTTEDGARLRPDVVVKLPGEKRVIIDSKVSLTAFEAYVNAGAGADEAREGALGAHITSLRSHIRGLSLKNYQAMAGSSFDYVIMFVPIEGALAAAIARAPDLTGIAVEQNVMIATPTTLMIALRTIANVWQTEARNRNAEAIADRAGKLYDKFAGFALDLERLGKSLDAARGVYGDAMAKLTSGRGNMLAQVQALRRMGAKTSKPLPASLLAGEADAGDEDA